MLVYTIGIAGDVVLYPTIMSDLIRSALHVELSRSRLRKAGRKDMRIKWPDLRFPPINLWNAPKQMHVKEKKTMATYDSVLRTVQIFDRGKMYEFKHFIFYEIMPNRTRDFSAELFEINGVECSSEEAAEIMGEDSFNLAMEIARDQ